ncbi:MAG TPA: nucleotidyltransferase family protein [Paracoccaceae bacterium]|nr:nucleotidyltransferase family protein [Paracoccaceae bacterium]
MTGAPPPALPVLILAAGASSRMGARDKLTEQVGGEPMIRRTVRAALATGAPVIVVVPPDRPARRAALAGLPVATVIARDAAQGMAASLRAGIAALPRDAAGVMVLPADMPGLTADALQAVIAAFAAAPSGIHRGATADGRPGHPTVFPADLIPALTLVEGDEGGRSVIAAHLNRLRLVPLPGDAAVLDLDTPDDWEAFRAGPSGGD